MILCHGFLGYFAGAAIMIFGLSFSYWFREIRRDLNRTLPENQRVDWRFGDKGPTGALNDQLWRLHVKRFPASRKRTYAMLSIALFFLIPIATIIICIYFPTL